MTATSARAMWKAKLRVGSQSVGVRMYSAAQEQSVRFNLLDKKGHHRVRQRMVNPTTGETVESEQIRRGAEVDKGVFVVLDEAELKKLEPETSRDIEVSAFVPSGRIDPAYYARPYWLGPDEGESERYFALVEALANAGREGLARWALRGREYVGVLRAAEDHLALVVLRHQGEVLPIAKLEAPAGPAIAERERKLGKQLLAAFEGEFKLDEFQEEYRERVLDLIAAKRKGKRLRIVSYKPRKTTDDSLAALLQKSLRGAA